MLDEHPAEGHWKAGGNAATALLAAAAAFNMGRVAELADEAASGEDTRETLQALAYAAAAYLRAHAQMRGVAVEQAISEWVEIITTSQVGGF